VLDAARDTPAARAAERTRHARYEAEGRARAAAIGRDRECGRADGRGPVGPLDGRRRTGIDAQHREIAVYIDARQLRLGLTAVGEGDRGRVTANVVRVGEHRAVADDYASATAPIAESDDRRSDLVEDR